MKRRYIFCFCMIICFNSMPQQSAVKNSFDGSFCDMLQKILSNWSTNYRNIIEPNETTIYDQKGTDLGLGYQINLKIPGSTACYIKKYYIEPNTFIARFGDFESEEDAITKLEAIKKQIAECLTNYQVKKATTESIYHELLANYEFTKVNASAAAKLNLQIENYFNVFIVYLKIDIHDEFSMTEIKEETNPDEKKTIQTPFAKQLLELLDYSKAGFDGISVERAKTVKEKNSITGDTSLILYYKPKFTLEGAKEVFIKVTLPNYKNKDDLTIEFIATFGADLSMSEAENLYNNLSTIIKKYFTRDFETNENKWDLSKTGDVYTKTLHVKPKNDAKHSFTLYLSPGMYQGSKYLTTVELTVK